MNTFGKNLRLTTFGESHGKAMGGIIDGFPPGFMIDFEKLQEELNKRKPGSSKFVSSRREPDVPEFLSGINEEGITLGTPIGFIIRNLDFRSEDYKQNISRFRPNHADYTYNKKYGIRDYRGGGRASARETLNWVTAGTLASQWLESKGIKIYAFLSQVGEIKNPSINLLRHLGKEVSAQTFNDPEFEDRVEAELEVVKAQGETTGGKVSCFVTGIPVGIGEPVADKLQARLAMTMMSINAAKAFEYGQGVDSAICKGSETADYFVRDSKNDDSLITETNFSGGIQGGISNGMPVYFTVTFKPTPTFRKELDADICDREINLISSKGRHDPCVAIRAVSVVKAMCALVLADFML